MSVALAVPDILGLFEADEFPWRGAR